MNTRTSTVPGQMSGAELGLATDTHHQGPRGISRLMTVPRGGNAELTAQVLLEDIQGEHRHCASRPREVAELKASLAP